MILLLYAARAASDWQHQVYCVGNELFESVSEGDQPIYAQPIMSRQRAPGHVSPFQVTREKRRRKAGIVPYSRKFPEQDRAIETVFRLMRQHPEGVTVNELNELMRAHNDKLQGEIAWFNSIDVLIDEGRVYTCPKWRERGYLESLKLFAK